jgi:hypothetical protein
VKAEQEAAEAETKFSGPARDLPVDRLERAFEAEITASMSLNVRGTAIAAAAPIGILLLAQFAATWLDDNRWEIPALGLMKGLLSANVVLLVIAMAMAVRAVWPKRGWRDQQKRRLQALYAGDERTEGQLLLEMVEIERASNEKKARRLRQAVVPLAIGVAFTCFIGGWFAWRAKTTDVQRQGPPASIDALEARVPPRDEQLRIATELAPRIMLHEKERYGPSDPAAFVAASRLRWYHPRGQKLVAARGQIDARSLGRLCDGAPNGCYQWHGNLAREITRPHETTGRIPGLSVHRGFALDPDGPVRYGDLGARPTVPVFFEFRRSAGGRLLLAYWFHYSFSRALVPGRKSSEGTFSHEGDWENVEILFDSDDETPDQILFYGHGAPHRIDWDAVCKVGVVDCPSPERGHPIVYSALDSHATYATAGRHPVPRFEMLAPDKTSAGGARWDSWEVPGGLRFATDQPWYGYGGAWGAASGSGSATGPLAPGRYKLRAVPATPPQLASGD